MITKIKFIQGSICELKLDSGNFVSFCVNCAIILVAEIMLLLDKNLPSSE
jgi:hypothetical protein